MSSNIFTKSVLFVIAMAGLAAVVSGIALTDADPGE